MMTGNHTILYVEDDADFAELNICWFTQQGYNIVYARNGIEAVEAFGKTTPDIVLLDIMMPGLSGFEVIEHIRETDDRIPVIFLTSLADSQTVIKGLELGAYDYIRKDAELPEIEARIRSVLARTGERVHTIHITENSRIDKGHMAIVVHGEAHKTGYRTLKLLQLLLQQKNRLVQRDYLTSAIWGDNNINGDIYLNQAIGTLRRILSADKDVKLKSYRNAGIILETDK